MKSCDIQLRAISQEIPKAAILDISWKLLIQDQDFRYKGWFRLVVFPHKGLLTHCGLVTSYGDRDLGQHWLRCHHSGNGLLSDGTKPLPKPMLTDHQWSPSDIHIRAISQEMHQPSVTQNPFENYISKLSLKFPRGQWVNACWYTCNLTSQSTVSSAEFLGLQ